MNCENWAHTEFPKFRPMLTTIVCNYKRNLICETNSTKQDNSHFYLGTVPNNLSHLFAFHNPTFVELNLVDWLSPNLCEHIIFQICSSSPYNYFEIIEVLEDYEYEHEHELCINFKTYIWYFA